MRFDYRYVGFLSVALGALSACNRGGQSDQRTELGKYVLLDTMTDDASQSKCKQNVEDTLVKYPDVRCLVGLWAYNPPAMLAAVKDAGKAGKIALVAFDEHEQTLQGVKDGHIYGTIVQQPYEFGYHAVRILAHVARGDRSVLPPGGIYHIPHRVIKKDNVEEFHAKLKKLTNPEGTPPASAGGSPTERVKVAFITNNTYEFWTIARRGTEKAAAEFNVDVEFYMPPRGTADEQKAAIEDLLGKVQGIAVSPNDAQNRAEFFNMVADRVPLITQDSDLPKGSKRLCYIGTNNVEAGRAAGELIKQAIPEGGKFVIYVGKLDVENAVERRQGLIEVLSATKTGSK